MSDMKVPYNEWNVPIGPPGDHFLNEISNVGAFRSINAIDLGNESSLNEPDSENAERIKVYTAINIYDIRSIKSQDESFTCRLRLYLFWEMDCQTAERNILEPFRQKALELGHYYTLTDSEVEKVTNNITIPTISFFNATEVNELDAIPSIRIYGGQKGAILWNCGFIITFKEYFPLHRFPFDVQQLQLDIRQDDSRSWDKFDLTICCVQFHAKSLQIPEWKMYGPSIQRGHIPHKSTIVTLNVRRLSRYYVTNIIAIMVMLSSLSFVVFALPSGSLSDRISVNLTLLLTAVAFKLVIADSIPKVGYSTLLDKFVLGNMGFLFLSTVLCTLDSLTHDIYDGFIFLFSIISFILINVSWVLSVLLNKQQMKVRALDLEDGRNWYSSFFANPFFLPEPKRYE